MQEISNFIPPTTNLKKQNITIIKKEKILSNFEVVERKGLGHPDTLADGLAEAVSIAYSKYCINNFGAILHHNVDKTTVTGGLVDIGYGYGKVLKPAKVIINGRMSTGFNGVDIPVEQIQKEAVKQYLKKVLPNVNLDTDVTVVHDSVPYSHNPFWYHPRGLEDLPEIKNTTANDTSTCVGYWPLSAGEKIALSLEGYFYNTDTSPRFDYIGQDIKCMVVIKEGVVNITMCIPFISTKTPNEEFYKEKINEIYSALISLALNISPSRSINLAINNKDSYLLLTGSCIEAGEEGVVGRGNRSRGVISSTRPFSMEASNGKNPVYHVGKIHTLVADELAMEIGKAFDCSVNVYITCRIGDDLYLPQDIVIEVDKDVEIEKIHEISNSLLAKRDWTDKILAGAFIPKVLSVGVNL